MTSPFITYPRAKRALRRNAQLSRPQFEAEHLQRFRDLVRHAQKHAPFVTAWKLIKKATKPLFMRVLREFSLA